MAASLRESVPGRSLPPRAATLLLSAGAGLALVVTFATWWTHASQVPAGRSDLYWRVCFATPTILALPALALALLLAFRAYPTRPPLIGALAGLGAGLLMDGSWRTYCEVSDPAHVLSSHLASVLLLTFVGIAAAAGIARFKK